MAIVVPDMKLSPNVGSDRSWVWNAAADVSEGEPEACTLAIRFANSESKGSRSYNFGNEWLTSEQMPTSSRRHSLRPSRRTRPYSKPTPRQSRRRRPARRHRLGILEKHSEGSLEDSSEEIVRHFCRLFVWSVTRRPCF